MPVDRADSGRECPDCGYQFPPPKDKGRQKRGEGDRRAIAVNRHCVQWLPVKSVEFKRHNKPGSPPSMRVDYRIGLNRYSSGYALCMRVARGGRRQVVLPRRAARAAEASSRRWSGRRSWRCRRISKSTRMGGTGGSAPCALTKGSSRVNTTTCWVCKRSANRNAWVSPSPYGDGNLATTCCDRCLRQLAVRRNKLVIDPQTPKRTPWPGRAWRRIPRCSAKDRSRDRDRAGVVDFRRLRLRRLRRGTCTASPRRCGSSRASSRPR